MRAPYTKLTDVVRGWAVLGSASGEFAYGTEEFLTDAMIEFANPISVTAGVSVLVLADGREIEMRKAVIYPPGAPFAVMLRGAFDEPTRQWFVVDGSVEVRERADDPMYGPH